MTTKGTNAPAVSGSSRGPWRLEGDVTLTLRGALHVGTGESLSSVSDAPVLLDSTETPYVPGSSLRGLLRAWCEREAAVLGISRATFVRLFGPSSDELALGAGFDRQGRLSVSTGALVGAKREVWDHVRLDRETGAAAHGGKFDQEVVRADALEFRLRYEGDGPNDPDVALLLSAVAALGDGIGSVGGKGAWGLGAISEASATWRTAERSDAEGLASYLAARLAPGRPLGTAWAPTTWLVPRAVTEHTGLFPWSWLRLDLELSVEGPLLVAALFRGDPARAGARAKADHVYQTTADDEPFVPGSSIRGALQAHARRIAESVGQPDVAQRLFGDIKQKNARGDTEVGRGLLSVGDAWLTSEPQEIHSNHVAIDRLTGFSADQKKFDDVALASPTLKTSLVIRWPGDREPPAALALLLLTLRDVEEGLLWLGSRTTRGYGHVERAALTGVTGSLAVAPIQKDAPWTRTPLTMTASAVTGMADQEVVRRAFALWEEALNAGQEVAHG